MEKTTNERPLASECPSFTTFQIILKLPSKVHDTQGKMQNSTATVTNLLKLGTSGN